MADDTTTEMWFEDVNPKDMAGELVISLKGGAGHIIMPDDVQVLGTGPMLDVFFIVFTTMKGEARYLLPDKDAKALLGALISYAHDKSHAEAGTMCEHNLDEGDNG